jgi:hypothetical protein
MIAQSRAKEESYLASKVPNTLTVDKNELRNSSKRKKRQIVESALFGGGAPDCGKCAI